MGQTSYQLNTNPYNVGTLGFTNDYTGFSYSNPNSELTAGVAVVGLPTDKQCDLPSVSNTRFVGCVIKDPSQPAVMLPTGPNSNTQISTYYPIQSLVAVMSRGQLQVQCYSAVTTASLVYIIHSLRRQQTTLVFSADLVAANVINGTVAATETVVVNGQTRTQSATNPIAPVTFAVSNASTLTAIAAAIAALPGVISAVSDGVHTITVTAEDNVALVMSGWVVTLGASQATVAITTTVAAIYEWQRGWFVGSNLAGVSFQVSPGCRWVESSGLDPYGNLCAMLDINIPGIAP